MWVWGRGNVCNEYIMMMKGILLTYTYIMYSYIKLDLLCIYALTYYEHIIRFVIIILINTPY